MQIQEEKKEFSITVINDGHLIPDSEKENIFNPFYRLKETENQQGSGIGLSLARSLTEFHKGTLSYQQTTDGKNQFRLTLPEEQEDCYQLVHERNTEESSDQNTEKENTGKSIVLIVEDQTDMRQFIAKELSDTYRVLEAANGKEAVNVLKENTVNLIISDVMMPVMDGFELCNVVKTT